MKNQLSTITSDLGLVRALLVNFPVASQSPALCARVMGRKIQDPRLDKFCHEFLMWSAGDYEATKQALKREPWAAKFFAWADRVKGGAK